VSRPLIPGSSSCRLNESDPQGSIPRITGRCTSWSARFAVGPLVSAGVVGMWPMKCLPLVHLALAIVLICTGCGDHAAPTPYESHSLGVDFEGRPVTSEEYQGTVLLVCFWASWCSPCRSQLSTLDSLQAEFSDAVRVVCVAVSDSLEQVTDFLATHPHEFRMTLDPDLSAARALCSHDVVPITIVIDSRGRVQSEKMGPQWLKDLRPRIIRSLITWWAPVAGSNPTTSCCSGRPSPDSAEERGAQ
jgi:peroxiredoxin